MDFEGEPIKLTINSEYAKKYELRKKDEELSKLKEKFGDMSDVDTDSSSTSEEEDEFGELVTPEVDAQIMKTIVAIKSKDPKVYDSQSNFFADEEIQKAHHQWLDKQQKKKSEAKPMHLKDYHRKILLENGAEEIKAEEEDYQNFLLENMADTKDAEILKQWQNYKNDPNINEDEAFLMDFILKRGWIDKESDKVPSYDELIAEHHDDENEKFEEAVDQFESKYNFRFEEEGSTKVVTYARNLEGSMRRTDNKRKLQRQARSERKEEEKKRKIEGLKRLKNLKKKEIFEKLQKIKEITGNDTVGFDDVDLEEDFDPDKYDKKMNKVFDDNYYAREDDNEKPDWNDDINIDDIACNNSQNINSKINAFKEYNDDQELDKGDYEDIYRQNKPVSFGLTPAEILLADEKDLNEFVSLKKLAPYRPEHVIENDLKKYSKKKRLRQFRKKLELSEEQNPPENNSWRQTTDKSQIFGKKEIIRMLFIHKNKNKIPVAFSLAKDNYQ
ncbi:15134_t:CDS:10 [Funneliformis geosporum]|uniref:15134_t:CDS:1 n=1 Tax=Funneliformis geosporum TaxID=1117311 RepID=A0A9W4WJ07_9GLOM|nr:15134_t:CDS:10 [Funneliformis geosporum]